MKKKILIVGDDLALSHVLDMPIKNSYEIVPAKNGKEGVDMAASQLPDLILVDIRMPVMDGLQALTLFKEDDLTAAIPVIFRSGKVESRYTTGFQNGCGPLYHEAIYQH